MQHCPDVVRSFARDSIRAFYAAALLLLAPPATTAHDDYMAGYSKGQLLLFVAQHLHNVTVPALLEYYFYQYRTAGDCRHTHRTIDTVTVRVTTLSKDGSKNVVVNFSGKDDTRAGTEVSATYANPLITTFLQRDVDAMAQTVVATPDYLRHLIRQALADQENSAAIEISYDGRKLPASKITLHPFADKENEHIDAAYREKYYEFVIAADVPGGVYSIKTFLASYWCSTLMFHQVK